ncbi:hypothetical protein ACFY2Z_30080 [Streptomyces sp. NPDC001222]
MTADRLLRLDSADKARERPPGARNDIHFTKRRSGRSWKRSARL